MRFPFTTEARLQLRAIDRPVALRILETLNKFGEFGFGDVKGKGYQKTSCGGNFCMKRSRVLELRLDLEVTNSAAGGCSSMRFPLFNPCEGLNMLWQAFPFRSRALAIFAKPDILPIGAIEAERPISCQPVT